MRNFDYSKLREIKWDSEIMNLLTKIYEYKGLQNLYLKQKPAQLDRLIEIAKNQSTESSNEIEGIRTTQPRLKQLLDNKTTPRNRDEEEILGYKNAIDLIFENYEFILLKPNYILQLHQVLLEYTNLAFAGNFKDVSNAIVKIEGGKKTLVFKPASPLETPYAIERICDEFNKEIAYGYVDPLILICNFVLDFLCIHPFNDGNGRMSRLLTLLLMIKSDFLCGKYISLEQEIVNTKESYYRLLELSDENWHKGQNDPSFFIKYMLSIILKCYKDFEERISFVEIAGAKSTSYDIVKAYASKTIGKFTKNDVLEHCPTIKRSSVEAALKKLTEQNYIKKYGSARATYYIVC